MTVGAAAFGGVVTWIIAGNSSLGGVGGFAIGVAVTAAALTFGFLRFQHWMLEEFSTWRKRAAVEEADEMTRRLLSEMQKLDLIAERIRQRLERVSSLTSMADHQFDSRAYVPFWNLIESCTREVSEIDTDLQEMAATTLDYTATLNERLHNFPELVLSRHVDESRVSLLKAKFGAAARRGEVDFQFSMIRQQLKTREALMFEMRKTRRVLRREMKALDDAVSSVGEAVDRVAESVRDSSSEIEEALENVRDRVAAEHQAATAIVGSKLDRVREAVDQQSDRVRETIDRHSAQHLEVVKSIATNAEDTAIVARKIDEKYLED